MSIKKTLARAADRLTDVSPAPVAGVRAVPARGRSPRETAAEARRIAASARAKLSPKQRELLARAASGEDRQLPERLHEERGRRPFVVPARRWFVPPGFLVPEGSAEYSAARTLVRSGLLKRDYAPQSPELPHGLGGYSITPRGRRMLA